MIASGSTAIAAGFGQSNTNFTEQSFNQDERQSRHKSSNRWQEANGSREQRGLIALHQRN
jgi:hypothetical protein